MGFIWSVRDRLGGQGRRRVRAFTDPVLAPLCGSVRSSDDTCRVALTLDDGPDVRVTEQLLGLLGDLDVRATFFLLSERALKYPELVRRLVEGGHEIALHGRDHRRVAGMRHRDAHAYLRQGRAELESVAGQPVTRYRPPYGSQSLSSYLGARRAGLEVVVWSADAQDWVDRDLALVVGDAVASVDAGGILLLHERIEPDPPRAVPTTTFDRVELVRRVVLGLRARGLEPTTVAGLAERSTLRSSAWFRP